MTTRIRGLLVVVVLLAGCAHAPAAPATAGPKPKAARPAFQLTQMPAMTLVYAKVKTPEALWHRLRQLLTAGHEAGWHIAGPPMVVVPKVGPRAVAIQVEGPVEVKPPFTRRKLGSTRAAVKLVHGTLAEAEAKARGIAKTLLAKGETPTGPIFLILFDDPAATAPSERRTVVTIPIQ